MKPTLEEVQDNYKRVLLRLSSGELAGIIDDGRQTLQVLRKTHWIDRAITTSDLDKSYHHKNRVPDFNIDAIAFMNDTDEVDYYINNYDQKDIAWDWDINNPHNLKFKKGDKVIVKSTEYRDAYKCALECIGTIVDAEYTRYLDDEKITYRVRIDNLDNKHQVGGLWVFHKEKSLELYRATNMNKLYHTLDHPIYVPNEPTPYQLYKPSNIGGVCCDQLDTISAYIDDCIAQAVLDKPIEETKTFNIKGETIVMNNLVEIYKGRKYAKIDKKYKDLRESVKNTDPRYKIFKECVDTLDKLYKEDKVVTPCYTDIQLSEETTKKLIQLDECRREECAKLHKFVNEVTAQLQMCETYDQKMNILKTYKIIKENGRVNA